MVVCWANSKDHLQACLETPWNGNSRAQGSGVETAVTEARTDIANGLIMTTGSSRAPAMHCSTANWLWEAFPSVPGPLCRLPLCICVSLVQVTCCGWVALGSCCHCWLQTGSAERHNNITQVLCSQPRLVGCHYLKLWCKSGSLGNPLAHDFHDNLRWEPSGKRESKTSMLCLKEREMSVQL